LVKPAGRLARKVEFNRPPVRRRRPCLGASERQAKSWPVTALSSQNIFSFNHVLATSPRADPWRPTLQPGAATATTRTRRQPRRVGSARSGRGEHAVHLPACSAVCTSTSLSFGGHLEQALVQVARGELELSVGAGGAEEQWTAAAEAGPAGAAREARGDGRASCHLAA
jgi:hypothetical protein